MAITAGVVSLLSVGSNQVQLVATPATGAVGSVTQQWYMSTAPFVAPAGDLLVGETSLSLSLSNLIPNTAYYFTLRYEDSTGPVFVNSNQLVVTTVPAQQRINIFAQAPFLGMLDLKVGPTNVIAGQVDVSQVTPVYNGQAMQIVNSVGGIPKFAAVTSPNTPQFTWGFIVYDIKSRLYNVGDRFEIAMNGSCMWLYATEAIPAGSQVVLDTTSPGAVQLPGHSANMVGVGVALDQATAYGQLIRVIITAPSYTVFP